MKLSLALAIGLVGIGILVVGIRKAIEVHTYTQTSCLVKNSSLWICGQQMTIGLLTEQCIQPKWLIRFIYYKKQEETTILGEKYYRTDVDNSRQTYEFDKYRVEIFKYQ